MPDVSTPVRRRASLNSWIASRGHDVAFAPRWWWALGAVAVVASVYIAVAWTEAGPSFAADEVGMLGASQVIARGETSWVLSGSGYMPGLAILTAPAWWFTNDQYAVYHVGLAIGVVVALACIVPLAALVRRFGIRSATGSVVLASIIMLAPARTISANYFVAESLLLLATAATMAAAWRASNDPTLASMATVGFLAGLCFLAHGRGAAIVGAVAVWALLVAGRRWKLSVAAISAAAITAAASWVLYRWITSELYWNDRRVEITVDGWREHSLSDLAGTTVGFAWYAMVAWPAVAIVGAAVLFKRSRFVKSPEMLIVLAIGASVVFALVQLDNGAQTGSVARLDTWIYGRYLEHLATLVSAAGIAVLVRVRHRLIPLVVFATSIVVTTLFMLLTVPHIPDGGYWSYIHVAGVSPLLSEANYLDGLPEPWLWISLSAAAIGTIIAIAAWVRIGATLLAIIWAFLTLATATNALVAQDESTRAVPAAFDVLRVLPANTPVAFNIGYGANINIFAFGAHPRAVVPVSMEVAAADFAAVYTISFDASPAEFGARPVVAEASYGYLLWVFPGPLYDDLDAQGKLMTVAQSPDASGV